MASVSNWIEGARLRTLPAAAAPVIVGSAAAHYLGGFSTLRASLALLVALALQVGVNYANDYSDGIRGTDDNRKGPARLTGGASPNRRLSWRRRWVRSRLLGSRAWRWLRFLVPGG